MHISDSRRDNLKSGKETGDGKTTRYATIGMAGLAVVAVIVGIVGIASSGGDDSEEVAPGDGVGLRSYSGNNTVRLANGTAVGGDKVGKIVMDGLKVNETRAIQDDMTDKKPLSGYGRVASSSSDYSLLFHPRAFMFTGENHTKLLAGVSKIQLRVILGPGMTKFSADERRRQQMSIGNGILYEGKLEKKSEKKWKKKKKKELPPVYRITGPETRWNLTNIDNPRLTILITPVRGEVRFEMKRTRANKFLVKAKLDKSQEPLCTIDVLLVDIRNKIDGAKDIYGNEDKGCELEADLEVT